VRFIRIGEVACEAYYSVAVCAIEGARPVRFLLENPLVFKLVLDIILVGITLVVD